MIPMNASEIPMEQMKMYFQVASRDAFPS